MSESEAGTPYSVSSPDPIDEWSREMFDALSNWAEAHSGRWTRWDPGYLLLEIDRADGEEIELIRIDTADEEATIEFGGWHTHLPERDVDAAGTAREAMEWAAKWMSGAVRTAVFMDDEGKWRGTAIVATGDPVPPAPSDGMAATNPTKVELRGPRRAEWRTYAI